MPTRRISRPQLQELEGRDLCSISLVADVAPGYSSSTPYVFAAQPQANVNGTLFFQADDGTHGEELWKSDGTTVGTTLVKDILPGGFESFPDYLTAVNGTAFFVANDGFDGKELWKSDGTTAGTTLVKDMHPGSTGTQVRYLTNLNGTLFFSASDGVNGYELWKSDGTDAGTVLVKDMISGSGSSYPSYLTNVNGTLFFAAYDDIYGNELWKSDGTEGGTVLVKDIYPGNNSFPYNLANVNGTLFFVTYNGPNNADDGELWKSDGTAAGTVLVKDIKPIGTSAPSSLTDVDGTVFFIANDGANGKELWKSDGTDAGTVLVKDIAPGFNGSDPASLTNVNGELFFTANNGTTGRELWKSDGTTAGTVLVKDVHPVELNGGNYGSNPTSLTNVSGTLFFSANDGVNGDELWQSDGTDAGTVLVSDLNAGSYSSSPSRLLEMNGLLFFRANDGMTGDELRIAMPPAPDTTGAQITSTVFSGTAMGTFDKVTLTFSEAVQPSTLDANITLAGPGGNIPISGITAVAGSNNTQFAITFASQATPGDYTLNAGVGILDAAGNPLTQAFSVTRTLGASTVPRVVAIGQSDGSVKILNGDANEVLVANFRPLDANGQQYKSTVAVALGDLDGDGIDELFVAAQKRAGVAGLDASKAGKVFVYDTATIIATGNVTPFDTFTPFDTPFGGATNPDGTTIYQTGFELATGDVNGDGTVDLVAASRGDVGQISVMSGVGTGTGHARIGGIVTPFGANYRGKVTVAAGNFIAETGTQNDEVAAARGNTDSTSVSQPGTTTRVAMFDLVGSTLSPITFSGAISPEGIPSRIQGDAGQVIDRNAFVAAINLSGTGTDLLLFAARDFVSNPANPQIRVAVYGVNASGFANLQSSNADGDGGSFVVGNQVGSYAIARSDIDNNGADALAMVVDGPSAGVLYLAPLTGADLGGLTTAVLTGGVRITSN